MEDCTGYIAAGTVTSSAIAYTPFYNRYYGFVSSRTPSDAEVQALTQDHTNAKTLTVTLTNPDVSTPMYICYRYSSLLGALTSVTVNGFPSTASFDYTVTGPFVNAQSYSSNYYLVIGKNKVDNSGLPTTTIVFQ